MIRLIDVHKEYDNGTKALKGVNLRIDDGEFVFLVGPSGSGKSTVIKLITAEIAATEGRLMVNGYNLNNISPRQVPYMRRTLGIIFQDFRLIEKKTVHENLAFAMRAIGASNRELRRRIPYVLQLVGLEQKADRYPGQLSGGEQQRVAIARALVNNPSMITADEPTGNLTPSDPWRSWCYWSASMSWVLPFWWLPMRKRWSTALPSGSWPSRTDVSSATKRVGTTMARKFDAGYYFSEGFHSIFTHGFMSFAAVCMIVACLLIMGSFSLLAVNLDHMLGDLEAENEMLAYIDENYTEEQARSIQPEIETLPNVTKVTFVSREEALEDYKEGRENNPLLDDLPDEVLRDRFRIHVENLEQMEQTEAAVEQVTGVANVRAAIDIANGFVLARNIATGVAVVLIGILLVVSLFIIANTIKLATFYRREEIAIMKMCGATDAFIQWPFVVEGLILGLTGALLAFFAQWGIYQLVAKLIIQGNGLSLVTMVSYTSMIRYILAIFCGTGALIGVCGSLLAIRKFLQV